MAIEVAPAAGWSSSRPFDQDLLPDLQTVGRRSPSSSSGSSSRDGQLVSTGNVAGPVLGLRRRRADRPTRSTGVSMRSAARSSRAATRPCPAARSSRCTRLRARRRDRLAAPADPRPADPARAHHRRPGLRRRRLDVAGAERPGRARHGARPAAAPAATSSTSSAPPSTRSRASSPSRVGELEAERGRFKETLQRYGETLAATHDLNALVGAVLDTAVQATRARGGRLLLYDPERGEAIEQARIGTARGSRTDLPMVVAAGIGLEGEALSAHEPRVVQAPRAMLAVPILREHQLLGLVTTVDPEDGGFGDDDIESLSALAVQAGRRDRERAPAPRRRAPGGHRRADRPRQPAPVLRGARAGVRALPAVRDAALADPARHRRLQADQRHSRPPRRRRGAARRSPRRSPS